MTAEQERWTEAATIERLHRQDAPRWVAERVATLALAGDAAGVQHFRDIAAKLDALTADPGGRHVQ